MFVTLLYFILALLLLVIVHEYGHFQVARWCGVKVLRFSFGFGKVLATYKDKKGTEYVFSLLPLGGYVSMLDESEGVVSKEEKTYAFNNKSIWVRIAIVTAGPLFNLIFAGVALWLVLVIGTHSLAPIIASVKPDSIASKAGLASQQEIIEINHRKVNSWRDFQYVMMPLVGSDEHVSITVKSLVDGKKNQYSLPLSNWHLDNKNPDPLNALGIEPFIPVIAPVIGEVTPDSPAASAGLHVNDLILSVDGHPLDDWMFLVDYVKKHPDTRITLNVKRNDQELSFILKTGSQDEQGNKQGFIGIRSQKMDWPSHWLRLEREDPVSAIGTALGQTIELTKTTFILMGRLVTGRISLKSISGPVGIAQGAGNSGRSGLTSYLFFLALVSISLGALNLLPIPMLDGGHLLYYVLEMIRRKPLSHGAKTIGIYLGLIVLVALMCIALNNDISRLRG